MENMRTEEEKRRHRCCFTGHRPEKLGASEWKIKAALKKEIRAAVSEEYTVFITGMARGVDLWAAETVLELRERGAAIRLICAVPFPGFERRWEQTWRERYREVLERADLQKIICPTYSKDCFQVRNRWMVDHSSQVIAVYNGTGGGTHNTLEYAAACGVAATIIPCGGKLKG